MTPNADTPGSLALSPLPGDAGRPASTTLGSHRTLRTATVLDPAQSAEIAQARVFEKLLQAERRELQELARTTDETPDSSDACSPESRAQIRARLDEIHDLLRALGGRFPHAASDSTAH
ncbi:MAG: hypothetical protein QOG47_1238 [Mycobacterium sp.]|nr:hypothetical protein [Mycobacterium sp.]